MRINYNTNDIIESKVLAIKQVYHDWGFILRRALREVSPVDRGNLRRAIRFRVESPKNKRDITGTVRLLVGILDNNSPVLKYLKFVVDGTRTHFVPIKTRGGKFTGILGWAQRKNLIYFGRTPKGNGTVAWRWRDGQFKGKKFGGVKVSMTGNNMFERVYNRYYAEIASDINRIMEGE